VNSQSVETDVVFGNVSVGDRSHHPAVCWGTFEISLVLRPPGGLGARGRPQASEKRAHDAVDRVECLTLNVFEVPGRDNWEGEMGSTSRRTIKWIHFFAALGGTLALMGGSSSSQVVDERYAPLVAPHPAAPKDEHKRRKQPVAKVSPSQQVNPSVAAANPALSGLALDSRWPKTLYVVSDSVLLGAKSQLINGMPDWRVTFVGRQSLTIPKAIEQLPHGSLGSVVVVGLGYNSSWQRDRQNFKLWSNMFDKSAEDMIAALKRRGAEKIVWVLLRELGSEAVPSGGQKYGWYFPYVNERLRALKLRHPELALADWTTVAHRSGITSDAIHLNPRGAELMVGVVRVGIGLNPVVTRQAREEPAARPARPQASEQRPSIEGLAAADARGINTRLESKQPKEPSGERGTTFRDCDVCPEMVVIPAGSFDMGANSAGPNSNPNEVPQHPVTIGRPFAVGKFEVTFAEWEACVAAKGCSGNPAPSDEGWGRDKQPVVNVNWHDAIEYVTWLSRVTGAQYRLLSEAEWEYAARAGTTSQFSTGEKITAEQANFQTDFASDGVTRDGTYREQPVAVGSFAANAFGLHDMHGNVWEWVQDNWHEDYSGAPRDGAVAVGGDDTQRALRGGSWYSFATEVRSATRRGEMADYRAGDIGFRVARSLSPARGVARAGTNPE
jgi:formylglycine-generating enzyme required for sulfatase activity